MPKLLPSKYQLASKKFDGFINLEYNDNGVMTKFEVVNDIPDEAIIAILMRIPLKNESGVMEAFMKGSSAVITPIKEDLSFDRFWIEYDNKVGNKKRAEKLWTELSEQNKLLALKYIKRYDSLLKIQNGIAKLYPETYLNQKRWNN